ncbi:KGK domain-containing protein [Scytonema sp. UIC 10036]|uniref:KGK domain-containing protein n=1 Tax=Scytonema sp. UIC 10036 TaxID=2304196 RepID=UPI001FAA8CD9|nr:KGK domain-containing protein [Scytonema sp. UIC 10036]
MLQVKKQEGHLSMLNNKLKQLEGTEDIILLENKIFNPVQIVNHIIENFEPKGNDLNLSCKNSFIKKYFKQKNVQGIFNRVEWKFALKQGVKCELLIPNNNRKQKGKLEIKVIIDFSTMKKKDFSMLDDDDAYDTLSIEDKKSSENLEIKVSLDFCPDEPEVEETVTNNQPNAVVNNVYWMVNDYK